MKYFVLIFGLLLVFSSLVAQTNQKDTKGRKQGEWVKKYPNSSVLMYKGTFKDDKPVGTFTYYYPSNKLKAVIKHGQNSNRSESVFYHENGKVLTAGIYRNMKKDSIWVSFNEKGRITMSETFKDDQLNGLKKLYYLPNDPDDMSEIVISEYNYKDGQVEGAFTEYYPNLVVRKTGQYKNHKRHGKWISYELNGQKQFEEHYQDGQKHGWFIGYDEKGKEAQRQYYNFDKLIEGENLKRLMEQYKAKGMNPNGGG